MDGYAATSQAIIGLLEPGASGDPVICTSAGLQAPFACRLPVTLYPYRVAVDARL